MRALLPVMILMLAGSAQAEDAATSLCRLNPAYAVGTMRAVIDEELKTAHDPSLDETPPDQLAQQASDQGVADCGKELAANKPLYDVLAALTPDRQVIGWDAFNVACANHSTSKADCVRAEVSSDAALRRMGSSNHPPGAKALIETCQLVLPPTVAMAEWRACVDTALLEHSPEEIVDGCKTGVPWHSAATGAEAGKLIVACLRKKP